MPGTGSSRQAPGPLPHPAAPGSLFAGERAPGGAEVCVVRRGRRRTLPHLAGGAGPAAWGHGGRPARRLAWAILFEASGHRTAADDWCADFCREVVAHLPPERFVLAEDEVLAWLDRG